MTTHEDRAATRLAHIVEAIDRILAYTAGMYGASLKANQLVLDAVFRNLQIIGEAARVILEKAPMFAAAHPDIPLRQARGVRNRVFHDYDHVDTNIVWLVIRDELPAMRAKSLAAIAALGGGETA